MCTCVFILVLVSVRMSLSFGFVFVCSAPGFALCLVSTRFNQVALEAVCEVAVTVS